MNAKRMWSTTGLLAAALLLLASGCGGAQVASTSEPTSEIAAAEVVSASIPESPAGQRLSWLLETLNEPGAIEGADLEAVFDEAFLTTVPVPQLRGTLTTVAANGPLTLLEAESESPDRVTALVRNDQSTMRVNLRVVSGPPHRIEGLMLQAADYLDPDLPNSWEALESAMREHAAEIDLYAARLEAGVCEPIVEVEASRPLAIGSAFKLWVLGALAEAVAAGDVTWEDELTVNPDWRSMSDAILREIPDGQPLTLRHYADAMISVSDNTATDHLIWHVGRERVEAAMVAMGNDTPELTTPFLTTREMFTLKNVWTQEQRDTYYAADDATRREYLQMAGTVPLGAVLWSSTSWSEPKEIERLEWFATGPDLCDAMAALLEMSETEAGAPVRDVLSINSGIGYDTDRWPYLGFKGGSEPGVLNFTWLLQRDDGEWFVLAMTANDNAELIDTATMARLAAAGFNLLAGE